MLLKRVTTALVLLLVLGLSMTLAAPWGFPVLALLFVAVGVLEWMRLLAVPRLPALVLAVAVGCAIAWLFRISLESAQLPGIVEALLMVSALLWIALLAVLLARRRFPEVKPWRFAYLVLGLLFLGACGLSLLFAYRTGLVYLVSILALVWIADIAAYFCGRAFGRHKLAPVISPGKTIEGALGGIAFVVVLATVSTQMPALSDSFFSQLWQHLDAPLFELVVILLVMLSIAGDLFESHLKRQAGVKDSGTLLPGHGGVLDRVDALLPVIPIAVLFGHYL